MSSEFYSEAKTLYAEFKKKELDYINADSKLKQSLMQKSDHNVPLQEYLQKIQQREKKNEETYQSILKQMNELDQQTDLFSSKLENLRMLSNIQVEHNFKSTDRSLFLSNAPYNLDIVQNNTGPTVPHFVSYNLKSSFTQTDSVIYCDNCRSQIQASYQTNENFNNSTASTIDILSVSKDEPQNIDLFRSQKNSFAFLNNNNNNSQLMTSSFNTEDLMSPPLISQNKNKIEKHSETGPITNVNSEVKSLSSPIQKEQQLLNDDLVSENVIKDSENNELLTKSLSKSKDTLFSETDVKDSENNAILTKSQSKPNDSEISIEVTVHKNDADSINHEFDFLESDSAHLSPKLKTQNNKKDVSNSSNSVNKSIDQVTGTQAKFSKKSSAVPKEETGNFQSTKEQGISYNTSEISGSVSEAHSDAISLSDSDSAKDNGSFTASAAYQSMLGNMAISSKINKEISESETEDEVEKTFVSTVQKSNVKLKSSVQPKKSKNVPQSADSKPDIKTKPASMNKPQSKLSKNTKKVLGIDTSSSSEIEAAVKPSQNKKDDDSDEFDFYD